MESQFEIRRAVPQDSQAIFELIQHLAHYERAPHEVINTPEKILQDGFGQNPLFYTWVATHKSNKKELEPDEIIGMALCYVRYSTWKGPVLYLEDLVVKEEFRMAKIGSKLLNACISFAKEKGYPRICWQVLDWNEPAIKFYQKYGATFDAEWLNCTLDL